MRAQQYIYTLCKTRSDGNVGYACYSKSIGLDDRECEEIQKYTTYNYSKELPGKGTRDELEVHPQNFCSFRLSNGKICIALSAYMGQYFDTEVDERIGNYISHALVFERSELSQYPVTLFQEGYLKSYITSEELSFPYPYPKLPEIEIASCGRVINIDRVVKFLESRETKFEMFISAFIKAKEEQLLLYLNDTQENIVLWISALQMLLPVSMCDEVSFATYKYYDKAVFHNTINKLPYTIIGVRDKAMIRFVDGSTQQAGGTFDYKSEINNGGNIIFDEINGLYTQGINISPYAEAMSKYYQTDIEAIYEFQDFLSKTDIKNMGYAMVSVFAFYELYIMGKYEDQPEYLAELLKFGTEHVDDEKIHEQVAEGLLETLRETISDFGGESLTAAIGYIGQHAVYLFYAFYEVLDKYMNQSLVSGNVQKFEYQIDVIKISFPKVINNFITWILSEENVADVRRFLKAKKDDSYVMFYLKFILSNSGKWSEAVYCFVSSILELVEDRKMLVDYIYKWISENDSTMSDVIIHRLIAGGDTQLLALEILRRNLRNSEKTEEYFWYIYKKHFADIQGVNIGSLVREFLELNGDIRQIELIVKRMERHAYIQYETLEKINKCLERHMINDLMTGLSMETAMQLVQSVINMNQTHQYPFICMNKLILVYIGKKVKGTAVIGEMQHITEFELNEYLSCINNLSTKEYKQYMTECLADFCKAVSTKEDMQYLLCCVCNQENVDLFFDMFTGIYRKKEDMERKTKLLGAMCAVLIDGGIDKGIHDKLSERVIKYMKKINEVEQNAVREQTSVLCESSCDAFFEQIDESGGKISKLKSLFRIKN